MINFNFTAQAFETHEMSSSNQLLQSELFVDARKLGDYLRDTGFLKTDVRLWNFIEMQEVRLLPRNQYRPAPFNRLRKSKHGRRFD